MLEGKMKKVLSVCSIDKLKKLQEIIGFESNQRPSKVSKLQRVISQLHTNLDIDHQFEQLLRTHIKGPKKDVLINALCKKETVRLNSKERVEVNKRLNNILEINSDQFISSYMQMAQEERVLLKDDWEII